MSRITQRSISAQQEPIAGRDPLGFMLGVQRTIVFSRLLVKRKSESQWNSAVHRQRPDRTPPRYPYLTRVECSQPSLTSSSTWTLGVRHVAAVWPWSPTRPCVRSSIATAAEGRIPPFVVGSQRAQRSGAPRAHPACCSDGAGMVSFPADPRRDCDTTTCGPPTSLRPGLDLPALVESYSLPPCGSDVFGSTTPAIEASRFFASGSAAP